VGYVNKSFQNGFFTFVSNPLNSNTNSLKDIIPNPPDGTQVWRWLVGAQDLDVANISTYSSALQQWSPNPQVKPGEGVFVVGGADFTNTFVGEVPQGALTRTLVGGGNFESLGSLVPVGGSLTNVLAQYPATDGDQVWTWNNAIQDLNVGSISAYSTALSKWSPDANLAVGEGFFLVRAGGPVVYTRNFTVQ